MLKCHFETLAIYTGSKKRVDFIYVQILKYLQHKLGIAENHRIIHERSFYQINVSYCKESTLYVEYTQSV